MVSHPIIHGMSQYDGNTTGTPNQNHMGTWTIPRCMEKWLHH